MSQLGLPFGEKRIALAAAQQAALPGKGLNAQIDDQEQQERGRKIGLHLLGHD
ncbi:hypothetical protein D3C81_2059080 [compost metagenome]